MEKNDLWEPNRLLVVQTGERVDHAKVFKAHAVPQGLRGNLINALKLLANQQEDGDGLIQNIMTNFCEVSRKGLTKGLRNFIQVDNHRALEVGHLREGMVSCKVRRPKGEEGYPEVLVRESPDELTLEHMKWALGSRVSMSATLQRKGGVLLWWTLTGTSSAKRYIKASKEKTWERNMILTKK